MAPLLRYALAMGLASPAAAQPMDMSSHDHAMHHDARDASGTSWQPESTPMFMWHRQSGDWSLALHENLFAGYDYQAGDRGDDRLASINWLMAMASHPLGAGRLQLRTMLSAEPWTVGRDGYPLLLQTGEAVDRIAIHDRQHAHDLFMEVAARVRMPIGDALGVELYVAPSGEPAVGPPAFPHRFTAMANPLAPLGHHWQDSTHISFGVITAGVFTQLLKLEGSWFNGREPDDTRYDFDLRKPDSFSVRLAINPNGDTSAQLSYAHLASPEQLEPGVHVDRATASAMWNRRATDHDLAVIGVIGHNDPSRGPATTAGLGEATLMVASSHTVFSRVELLQKSGEDLALPAGMAGRRYGMASFSVGYVYDVVLPTIVPGVGVVATVDALGAGLEPFYGTRMPWGAMVFVRLRPPEMLSMM